MNPGEIVIHEMQGNRMGEILDLSGKGIGEPGHASHAHPHSEVLPLCIAGRDMGFVRVARDGASNRAAALSWTVARCALMGWSAIELDQHSVINVRPKGVFYGGQLGFVPICRKLSTVGQPCR